MAGKFFDIPFAATGDKDAVPNAVQTDGSVSYSEGFGFDYERENTDPAYKPVPRSGINGLYFDVTQALGIIQSQGFADWTSEAAPYVINSAVRHNGQNWQSAIADNSDTPGVGAGATSWFPLGQQTQLLDAVRINIASASTVDLTSLAPNTRHINITGTTGINGFTIAAGNCYFVRFAGVLTLTNSAALVTQTGANITTAAGDTCLLRAVTNNNVELLAYSAIPASNAQVATGTNEFRPITPAGLMSVFGKRSFTGNDFIRIPDVPGGLIIQWGKSLTNVVGNGNTGPITLPVAFPDGHLCAALGENTSDITGGGPGWSYTATSSTITLYNGESGARSGATYVIFGY
ncbi:structural protein [Pseudomonas phage vB_PcuM_ KLEP17-4]|nr:structural protein [Pseudomonas phage vB_PcuM_ KLEP17-4]